MKKYTTSLDQTQIAYEISGTGEKVLLFVHGWLGNKRWWDAQRDYFSHQYTVVQMDLGGHGESGKTRTDWSAENFAADIVSVAKTLGSKEIILVGHSMSGVYSTYASLNLPNVKKLILVDTMKDLDHRFSPKEVDQMMSMYRNNFPANVKNIFPQYLFTEQTPQEVKTRLQDEFISQTSFAADAIEDLYKTDVREVASQVSIPVCAINSDVIPTSRENNQKYLKDFDFSLIQGVGHYPMLEKSQEFNSHLEKFIS